MRRRPRYVETESLPEALGVLATYGERAKLIAGGTAVSLMLESKLISPEVLISIRRVPDLGLLSSSSEGMRIGAMVPIRRLENSAEARQHFPALWQACASVGNVRVRNQATLGGNLAEADYASDPPTALMIQDAKVLVSSIEGERVIPISGFFRGFFSTALQPTELVTQVFVPAMPQGARSIYLNYKSRSSEDRPCVGVAVMASFREGACHGLRVAVGAACEIPQRLPELEASAEGQMLSDRMVAEIAEGYARQIETLDDLRGSSSYRSQMIRVHVQRAILEVRDGSR